MRLSKFLRQKIKIVETTYCDGLESTRIDKVTLKSYQEYLDYLREKEDMGILCYRATRNYNIASIKIYM